MTGKSRRADCDPTISLRQARTPGLGMLQGSARQGPSGSLGPLWAECAGSEAAPRRSLHQDGQIDVKSPLRSVRARLFAFILEEGYDCLRDFLMDGLAYFRRNATEQ